MNTFSFTGSGEHRGSGKSSAQSHITTHSNEAKIGLSKEAGGSVFDRHDWLDCLNGRCEWERDTTWWTQTFAVQSSQTQIWRQRTFLLVSIVHAHSPLLERQSLLWFDYFSVRWFDYEPTLYTGKGMKYIPGAMYLAATHRGKVKNIRLSTLRDSGMTSGAKTCILNFEKESLQHDSATKQETKHTWYCKVSVILQVVHIIL